MRWVFPALLVTALALVKGEGMPMEPAERILWRVEEDEGPSGASWTTLRFPTLRGVVYTLQGSRDLGEWEDEVTFYGYGQEMRLALFEKKPGSSEVPGGGAVPAGPGRRLVTMMAAPSREGGLVVSWRSLDDPERQAVVLMPGELSAAWEVHPFHVMDGEAYSLFVAGRLQVMGVPLETGGLGPLDEEVAGLFAGSLARLNEEVEDGVEVSGLVPPTLPAGRGGRKFYRLARRVVDSDGDGLADWYEYEVGTEVFVGDSDGDGISDGAEVAAGTDPRGHAAERDSDGDGVLDAMDALPGDALIRWERSTTRRYVMMDLGEGMEGWVPTGLTEDSEVLFDKGLWSEGEVQGYEFPADQAHAYESGMGQRRISPDGKTILERTWADTPKTPLTFYTTWVRRPEEGVRWDLSQGDGHGARDYYPLGVSRERVYGLRVAFDRSGSEVHTVTSIERYGLDGSRQSSLPAAEGFDLWWLEKGEQVSPSGWVATNQRRKGTWGWDDKDWRLGLWDPEGVAMGLPAVAEGRKEWVYLREMPDGSLAVVSGIEKGEVMLANRDGVFEKSDHFSGTRVRMFSGLGNALGSDLRLWVNGEWLEAEEWCPGLDEAMKGGGSFEVVGSNGSGVYVLSEMRLGVVVGVKLLVPVEAVPDWDRDGMITAMDRGQTSEENPWRFWRNSDDDSGTEGGDDISGADEPDYQGNWVDGVRDLVDFFPIHFDLKSVLKVLPETKYQYFLKHESQSFVLGGAISVPAFNVLWYPEAELGADPSGESGVGSYLKNLERAQDIAGRLSNAIPKNGFQIPQEMLIAAKEGKGVVLFESRQPTDHPIVLEIRKGDGSPVAEIEMPVKILEVESMFRSKFLDENLEGGTQGGIPEEPDNWPDSDRNGKHFIFVHGYNVSGEQARGWNSEMFKRMFWSGSEAMFTGVSWHGNEGQTGTATPDYWRNVHNAFRTSKSVADFVNALPGNGKCIAAHSLGNIVVSSAIKDHGLAVAKYYMVDAAVAIEAYSFASTLGKAQMSHPDWRAYDEKLWCSEWHRIFPESDHRRKMTWRDRFGAFANAYNFHSTGEEVLKNGDGSVPETMEVATSGGVRAWVKNEMSKGSSIGSGGGLFHHGTGGWDFNRHWEVPISHPYSWGFRMRTPGEAAMIPLRDLEEAPFFEPFVNDKFHDPALGSAEAAKYDEVSKALAESLPSLTFAAGANAIQILDPRNFDMMSLRNGWPEARTAPTVDPDLRGWRHSDIRNVAYLYAYKVFGEFVKLGELN